MRTTPIDPGPGYRLIHPKEILQADDEFLNGAGDWETTGWPGVTAGSTHIYRRRVPNVTASIDPGDGWRFRRRIEAPPPAAPGYPQDGTVSADAAPFVLAGDGPGQLHWKPDTLIGQLLALHDRGLGPIGWEALCWLLTDDTPRDLLPEPHAAEFPFELEVALLLSTHYPTDALQLLRVARHRRSNSNHE